MIKELNYLSEIKETQHLTNKEIAKALNVTEVTVSNWMENKTTPQRHLRAQIMKFASQYWTPGIIELPPCPGVWNNYICLRVYNVNNPFGTIIDLDWTGNETRIWPRMIEGWSKSYYKIRKSYNHPAWFLQSIIDENKQVICTTWKQFFYGQD